MAKANMRVLGRMDVSLSKSRAREKTVGSVPRASQFFKMACTLTARRAERHCRPALRDETGFAQLE